MTKTYYGNCWPKDEHLWLMQAAILNKAPAAEAFKKWLKNLDINQLDYPSYHIIPKLYKNLVAQNIAHPNMEIFKGIYQRTWAENQRRFYLFTKLVKDLRESKIQDIILLKGSAMTLSCYKDFGIRHMGDIDFLVSKELALSAMLKLLDLGFEPSPKISTDIAHLQDRIKMQHAVNFIGTGQYDKLCIDIHWSILYDIPSYNIDLNWMGNSDIMQLHGIKISTLNATHLLYQTCIHGSKYSPVPLTRWVMDAMTLLQLKHDKINWDALTAQAERDDLVLPIYETFRYLIENFKAPIPQETMNTLAKSKIFFIERLKFSLRKNSLLSLLLIPARLWSEHARTMPERTIFSKIIVFPCYLQKRCGLSQLWHLPFYLPVKIMMTVKNRFI